MITIVREPKELYNTFKRYELCTFCRTETKYWTKSCNTPICKDCAKTHTKEDL